MDEPSQNSQTTFKSEKWLTNRVAQVELENVLLRHSKIKTQEELAKLRLPRYPDYVETFIKDVLALGGKPYRAGCSELVHVEELVYQLVMEVEHQAEINNPCHCKHSRAGKLRYVNDFTCEAHDKYSDTCKDMKEALRLANIKIMDAEMRESALKQKLTTLCEKQAAWETKENASKEQYRKQLHTKEAKIGEIEASCSKLRERSGEVAEQHRA